MRCAYVLGSARTPFRSDCPETEFERSRERKREQPFYFLKNIFEHVEYPRIKKAQL